MNNPTLLPGPQARLVELDGLRGLAALSVVIGHLQKLWATDQAVHPYGLPQLPAPLDVYGTNAVLLFFILSGFVLSLPAVAKHPQSYLTFVTRRVFRVDVPYLVVLALSVLGAAALHGPVTQSDWFNQFWSQPVSWHLLEQHVLFLGNYDTLQYDPPIWSLVHEMRISLVFPILCALVLRLKNGWSIAIAILLGGFARGIEFTGSDLAAQFAGTLFFTSLFVIGILLARNSNAIATRFSRITTIPSIGIVCTSLFLYFVADSVTDHLAHHHPNMVVAFLTSWLTPLGAAGLIVSGLNFRPFGASSAGRQFAGWEMCPIVSISYTSGRLVLYCVHLLYGKTPLLAIFFLAFVLSLILSRVMFRFVELPAINLGRRLTHGSDSPHRA